MKLLDIFFFLTDEQKTVLATELPRTEQVIGLPGSTKTIQVASVASPLTHHKFMIRAFSESTHDQHADAKSIDGYQVTINTALSTHSQDWIVFNDVSGACEVALRCLQHWLVSKGLKPDCLRAFSLKNARIETVQLTFLAEHLNLEEAIAAKIALYNHAEALHNESLSLKPKGPDRVEWAGSRRHGKWTLKVKDLVLSVSNMSMSAIKSHERPIDFSKPLLSELWHEVQRYLIFDLTLKTRWLQRQGLSNPLAWNGSQVGAKDTAVSTIKRLMWEDFSFRRRILAQRYRPSTQTKDGQLIDWYYSHRDVSQHPLITQSRDPKAMFKKANARARQRFHIDYRIPCETVQECLCPDLSRFLTFINHSHVSPALKAHSFGPLTCNDLIQRLDAQLPKPAPESAAKKPRRSRKKRSTTSLPPPTLWAIAPQHQTLSAPTDENDADSDLVDEDFERSSAFSKRKKRSVQSGQGQPPKRNTTSKSKKTGGVKVIPEKPSTSTRS